MGTTAIAAPGAPRPGHAARGPAMARRALATLLYAAGAIACAATAAPPPPQAAPVAGGVRHVAWARNANIYEVNLRQYTPEGTFRAFEAHLPRLREMGVDILWLMPVQPIGVQERKGTLGSYYSVRDYVAVNPEFGTLAEFRQLVARAHALGMKVILDWVANHTAWDHPWLSQHPQWYQKDADGRIRSYVYDNGTEIEHWTDVVGLDYRQTALWPAMIEAMRYWVRETGIDGFRCDVAARVPIAFWERARRELEAEKPLFMLAEASEPVLHRAAFDMSYDWELAVILRGIAAGRLTARDLAAYHERPQGFPPDAYRMTFTSNHDINSWTGSDRELYGEGFKAFAVLAATWPGMPLVYSGQESGLDRRLAFFEKDAIDWKSYGLADFYAGLLRMKKDNPVLWNGAAGGSMAILASDNDQVLAFERRKGEQALRVTINFSATQQSVAIDGAAAIELAPWEYRIDPR